MEESQEQTCGTCIYRLASVGRFVCSSMKSTHYKTAVTPAGSCDRWKKSKRRRSFETMALEHEQAAAR